MYLTEQEMGENVRKIREDETCTVFQVKDDSGEGRIEWCVDRDRYIYVEAGDMQVKL